MLAVAANKKRRIEKGRPAGRDVCSLADMQVDVGIALLEDFNALAGATAVFSAVDQQKLHLEFVAMLPQRHRLLTAAAAFARSLLATNEFFEARADAILVSEQQFLLGDQLMMEEIGLEIMDIESIDCDETTIASDDHTHHWLPRETIDQRRSRHTNCPTAPLSLAGDALARQQLEALHAVGDVRFAGGCFLGFRARRAAKDDHPGAASSAASAVLSRLRR